MGFIRILIILVVLVALPVIVIFVFTKVKSPKPNLSDAVQVTPQASASPAGSNTPKAEAVGLKECKRTADGQNVGAQENCYWGSDEFSSPAYPSQQQGVN